MRDKLVGPSPPDPTLDNETYQDILSIIHGFGVAMERHPTIYDGKHEQDLRDLLLANLSTHYPSTTGETFNKQGRTDILVRHQGSNVFVAECKFWLGLQVHHATIDQLLSYLTWRDSQSRARLLRSQHRARADPRGHRHWHPSAPVLHPDRINARRKLDAMRVQAPIRPQPKCSSNRPLLPLPHLPGATKTSSLSPISIPQAAAIVAQSANSEGVEHG